MSKKKRPLVPQARNALNNFEADVMRKNGYEVDPINPENVKYEVAQEQNVPLQQGYNGNITAKEAGKVGGNIGGKMVKEMIKMAQQSLTKKQ